MSSIVLQNPQSLEETHATSIDRETLVNDIAERMIKEKKTAVRVICDMITEKKDDALVYISGSSFSSGNANPLDYAVRRFLRPFFGLSRGLIVGSAYHKALEYAAKHYIATGYYPRVGLQIREAIAHIDYDYNRMKDKEKEECSKQDLYKEVQQLVKVYQAQQKKNNPIAVEYFLKMNVPKEMLRDEKNALRILLTGGTDVVYEEEFGGELVKILSDHKSSKKPIYEKAEKSPRLLMLEKEIDGIELEMIPHKKIVAKKEKVVEKLQEADAKLQENTVALQIATEEGKATKAIQNRVDKWATESVKLNKELEDINKSEAVLRKYQASHDETMELLKPIQEAWEEECQEASLLKAKEMHGQQVAFYALIYMILTGNKIHRVRIENMVKRSEPMLQVFEWELDDFTLMKAEEQIQVFITKIELLLEGIDPMILFPQNTYGFIGEDTNEMLRDAEKVAKLLSEERVA